MEPLLPGILYSHCIGLRTLLGRRLSIEQSVTAPAKAYFVVRMLEIIKESTSANAKNDILVITGRPR